MKNFQFLLNDVYLLKLHPDKGCDIDCFVTKISDTINYYEVSDKFNFLCTKKPQYPCTITFRVYGDYVINKLKNLENETFTLYFTNAVDFNEGAIDNRKFTCSNISYVKCYDTKISYFNIENSSFCSDIFATFTVDFLWHENICDPNYNGHSYDENEIFNKKDIISIFNTDQNELISSSTKISVVDEESYFNNVDENCIVEDITNDMQQCLNKEITEKLTKAFEDTADTLLTSNLLLM